MTCFKNNCGNIQLIVLWNKCSYFWVENTTKLGCKISNSSCNFPRSNRISVGDGSSVSETTLWLTRRGMSRYKYETCESIWSTKAVIWNFIRYLPRTLPPLLLKVMAPLSPRKVCPDLKLRYFRTLLAARDDFLGGFTFHPARSFGQDVLSFYERRVVTMCPGRVRRGHVSGGIIIEFCGVRWTTPVRRRCSGLELLEIRPRIELQGDATYVSSSGCLSCLLWRQINLFFTIEIPIKMRAGLPRLHVSRNSFMCRSSCPLR